ncbi:MAG: hypothetical protein RR554_01850 [Vagococcus sp.]|uniref:hypothetical protein n=1 Tax=Vagococcus sp. TaxID=1933889 RepID=UPI002FCC9101
MKEHKDGFKDAFDVILNVLKKKKTIAIICIIVVGLVVSKGFASMYRDTIREQQIESVAKTTFKNKQFKNVKDTELEKALSAEGQSVVAIVDAKDNKGYKDLKKMFNQKTKVEGLPDVVYVYQPIYENSKTIKELKLKEKNNFLLMKDGKEENRFSFNELESGQQQLIDEIDVMINPKIAQKKPIRVDKKEDSSLDQGLEQSLEQTPNNQSGTRTSEVIFE